METVVKGIQVSSFKDTSDSEDSVNEMPREDTPSYLYGKHIEDSKMHLINFRFILANKRLPAENRDMAAIAHFRSLLRGNVLSWFNLLQFEGSGEDTITSMKDLEMFLTRFKFDEENQRRELGRLSKLKLGLVVKR